VSGVPRNSWLIAGGWLSVAASLLHVAVIFGGPDWYRFFGAGEPLAVAAERGRWIPHVMALAIAALLGICAAYAFSGAGAIRRLPLLRTGLVAVSAVYLLRGSMLFMPQTFNRPDLSAQFMLWSSLIVLVYGIVYAVGTWRAWPHLCRRKDVHALGS
jgi:hypothetical protein